MRTKSSDPSEETNNRTVPLPIQTFLWRQTSSFVRPKLGKLHEASCIFCQQAPGHHEMKEACKSMEKVLVQNIQFGLSPSLTEAIRSIPRWKFVQYSLPHVMLCAAQLLTERRETSNLQNVGTAASKLLYTLHWTILDAAEECADADREAGTVSKDPFPYIFSLTCIQEFVYLFAPLRHLLKEAELQNFRLENGLKIWPAFWDYKHPNAPCFTTPVRPRTSPENPSDALVPSCATAPAKTSPQPGTSKTIEERDQDISGSRTSQESNGLRSPIEKEFPETIPEETSSIEEEHVVIFRLASPSEDVLKESSVYQVPLDKGFLDKKSQLAEQGAGNSRCSVNYSDSVDTVTPNASLLKVSRQESWTDTTNRTEFPHRRSTALKDVTLATFLDVAVVRCLFMQHWSEEGIHWALQFLYYRLQEIGEEMQWRCPQRKRSSSLPVPKIEVSSFCTQDFKPTYRDSPPSTDDVDNRMDSQYYQTSGLSATQSPLAKESSGPTLKDEPGTPLTKKRPYKMSDLKAFVETRLLSRSDKTLEKIGIKQSGSRSSILITQEMDERRSRVTVDSDTVIPPRPLSALAQTGDGVTSSSFLEASPLFKGKSMPSLSCLVDELTSGYLGVSESRGPKKKETKPPRPAAPTTTLTSTHPVITVTEHHTGCITRKVEHFVESQNVKQTPHRLSRSHTDSNIVYPHEDLAEASGSAQYVNKDGTLSYRIILQAVHNVCSRPESCSMRVCETSFSILELLLDQNLLPGSLDDETTTTETNISSADTSKTQQQSNMFIHGLCVDIITRVFQHIGCPHGCGSSHRGPSSDFIRSQGLLLLSRLHRISPKGFKSFMRKTVSTRYTLPEVVDFLHALVGFCMDPGFVLSPTVGQKRNSRFGTDPSAQSTYPNTGTNFSSPRTIEGKVIASIFKTLVTRLSASLKYLKSSDNVPLYCDIRQLLAYIKDVHGGPFRRVLLSGLLDSVARQKNVRGNDSSPPEPKNRDISLCGDENTPSASFYVIDETMEKNNKRWQRKTNGDPDHWNDEGSARERKPSLAHCLFQSTQRLKDKDKHLSVTGNRSGKKASRIALAVNWIRKERSGGSNAEDDDSETPFVSTPQSFAKFSQRGSSSQVGITLQKARNRMKHKLTRIGIRRTSRKHFVSREVTPDPSRRNSLEMDTVGKDVYMALPLERKIVNTGAIRNGMLRLSFLLEACQPGVIPEAHLIAAALDLPQAPVVARAAFLLECAHFVHRCNRGFWPSWMKLNLPFFRPSGPLSNRGTPSGQRRTHILQRIAGCMFFSWAEAIGVRLEEMLVEDAMCSDDLFIQAHDEHRARALLEEDENEDFLVDVSVNPTGKDCPWALRLAACILLSEITAFLRDSFRRLPRLSRVSLRSVNEKPAGHTGSLNVGTVSSGGVSEPSPPHLANPSTSAIPNSASVSNAGRRWSMALSSMGHSQASAQSLQSIPGDAHPNGAQGERKISFVLHEPDDESLGSSNTTLTFQGEETEEKRNRRLTQGRPFLLRRGTMGNTGGSFKRRSLRLGRSQRERRDPDTDSIKRSGSVRSQRKVSSISDRSDTSDIHLEHDISGEESPGILSDDQPPESPSDIAEPEECISTKGMPWMRAVLLLVNSFNYQCDHQNVCHPRCYRRQMRASSRLLLAVRKVYDDDPQLDSLGLFGFTKKLRTHNHEEKKEKIRLPLSRPGSPNRIRRESIAKRDCSFHSSMAALSRDHIDLDLDRNKLRNVSGLDDKLQANEEDPTAKKKEEHPIVKYVKSEVIDLFQAPLLVIAKSATILNDESFLDVLPMTWELLLDPHKETAAAAAAVFILAAVRCPEPCMALVNGAFRHQDPTERINALLRFQVLWRSRYQVWTRMEEGAAHNFKVPPHSIEFTLPSPRIGVESSPVVDPPWMPHVKAQVQEVTLNQDTHRSLVTATKTRKKQQTELIQAALKAQEDRKRTERENFLITTVPVTIHASYEPALHHAAGDDHDDDEETEQPRSSSQPLQHAQALFPSCLSAAIVPIVQLLDDSSLNPDGIAVGQVANQVVNSCLVEDTALFLRYILEKLTRERQEEMFGILRRLLCYVPHLPQQTAYTLHNYLIGFIMFYVRSPQEGGQELIGSALSLLATVAPSVAGLLFKDLKQTLRKEQCDASILITANIPSAKKIVVHGPQGPDSGGIPSQFPVQEDTQFNQILQESLDFFGIDENKHKEYFLVDHRTSQIHNPAAYVRDYYFFKRSQYPQLTLVRMEPSQAYDALQKQAFVEKLVEVGKVLFVTSILKNYGQIIARVLFIHEELMKLPSFPRKALEADLNLYKNGCMGKELRGLDFLHKLSWVRLVSRMFEVMAGNFAYSGDIHLFINVVNGAFVLHCEDAALTRICMATLINAAQQFRNVFAVNGYWLIIPTLLRTYSNYQSNPLVTKSIEFTIQQFYILHRKPFLLQLFGSAAPLLDLDEDSVYGDASKVRVQALFKLLLSLERLNADPLHILDMVNIEKPLKALDFCYHGESDTISLMDCIALAVMGSAYATDTPRGHQLLTILEALIPAYLKHLQTNSGKKDVRAERDLLHQISVAMKTLITNAEALAKNYTGPQPVMEKTSSQRNNCSSKPGATAIEIDEDSHSKFLRDHFRGPSAYERDLEDDSESRWQEFRLPRTTLLSLVSDYVGLCSTRLAELNKKLGQDNKSTDLLDIKCHLRLADIAHSLLKVSSYDPSTMACRGLQTYMVNLMPNIDWSLEQMRPALTMIFRRLDKIFSKICKISSIRKNIDWEAAAGLLQGVYSTLRKCPYVVHVQHLRSLISTCQALILGEFPGTFYDGSPDKGNGRSSCSMTPPASFCSTVVRLIAMQILSLGEAYSLEQACGGNSVFPTAERAEAVLINLIIPLCLQAGLNKKDAPRMRQSDISFALTVILHALSPPPLRQTSGSSAGPKLSVMDARSGSFSVHSASENRSTLRGRSSLYQVAFLGLKILITCFGHQLSVDWPRIARCLREIADRKDGSGAFWNFLVFVTIQRGPLFATLLPLIRKKILLQVESEEEQLFQDLLQQSLNGLDPITPQPMGEMIQQFQSELQILKEDFYNRKEEDDIEADGKHSIVPDAYSDVSNASAMSRRPTVETGSSQKENNRDPIMLHPPRGSSVPNTGFVSGLTNLRRQWSVRSENRQLLPPPGRQISLQGAGLARIGYTRRTSYAGETTSRAGLPQGTACSAASDTRLNRRSLGPSSSSVSRTSSISETEFYEQDENALTEKEGGATSPAEADTTETTYTFHPRLQRQRLQSKGKTFRFKKSMANIEVSHIEVEQELVSLPSIKTPVGDQSLQRLLVPGSGRISSNRRGNQSPMMAESRLSSMGNFGEANVTTLTVPKPQESGEANRIAKASSPLVTVGVAVQVSAASYVPARPQQRSAKPHPTRNFCQEAPRPPLAPPPVPPRSSRLCVSPQSIVGTSSSSPAASVSTSPFKMRTQTDATTSHAYIPSLLGSLGSHVPRTCLYREWEKEREPPLLEESDSMDRAGEFCGSSLSVNVISDSDSRSGSVLPCILSAAGSSAESLAMGEEVALLPQTVAENRQLSLEMRDEDTLI